MKSLSESIFDKDLVTKDIMYHPKTKRELMECIEEQLKLQGPDANLNVIDVSKINDMSNVFSKVNDNISVGNIDISLWDVKNVRYMNGAFYNCQNFNSDLSKWDVRNVKDMSFAFCRCYNFNSDLSKWDVSNVTDMDYMFDDCKKFNSNLSKWNVENVRRSDNIFYGCDIPYKYKPKFK